MLNLDNIVGNKKIKEDNEDYQALVKQILYFI